MILVVYSDDGRVMGLVPGGEFRDGRIFVGNREVASGVHGNIAYVPDQDLSHLYVTDPDGTTQIRARYPDDFQLFSPEERKKLVDRETARAINAEAHSFVPLEEQIGILRDQLVRVLNALGIEPTEEFARLNEIAIREIEEGRKKKEAINAQDDSA